MSMCHQLLLAWCLFASIVSLAAQFAWLDYFDYDQGNGDCPGFKCQNGDCILPELHCDGVPDCISGDDELDCLHNVTCFMGDFQCDDGECVHAEFRCDGTADCLDYSDEANCENQTAIICKKDETKCRNNLQCVESDNLCDGETDCADGSDEESCPDFTCSSREYHCRNTTLCIPNQWFCDGTPDCEDGSDELCKQAVRFCEDFLCEDKSSCLELDAVCDRKNDCHDGSDERNDCHAKCQEKHCSSGCIPKEDDVKCACGPGYVLQDDGKTCADRDECLEKFDGEPACHQICVNIVGSFHCACHRWYVKEPDQRSCRLVPAPLLVFSSGNEIRQFDLRTKTQDIVVERLRNPVEDMDVVGTVARIFWIDAKAAYVTDMRGDAQVIASLGLVALKAVSYDWLVDLLYLLDSFLGVVATCNLENKFCATVVTGLAGRRPEDLLVDPLGKFLYWTENAFPARIMRSDLDGRNKVVFLKSTAMTDLDHLTLDYPTKTLYWMDKKLGTIYSTPIHTEELGRADLMQAVVTYIPQSSAFTIVEDRVLWWAQKGGKIMEENKFSGKDRQPLLQHSSRVTSLDVLHPGLHPMDTVGVRSSCSQLSSCADVCVRSRNEGFTCLCPPGMELKSNGRQCDYTAASPMLLIGKKEHIGLIPLYGIGRLNTRIEFADGLQKINTMATNPWTLEVVFSALGQDGKPHVCKSNSLLSRSFNFVEIEDRAEYLGEPRSLALDWVADQIFWLNAKRKTIEIFNSEGRSRSRLSFDVAEEMRSIAINVTKGLLFYSQWGNNPQIAVCRMDGSDCRALVDRRLKKPDHLVSHGDRLYWSDLDLGHISSVLLNGSGRTAHVQNKFPQEFAVHDVLFFWDNTTNSIQLVEPTLKQYLTEYNHLAGQIIDLAVLSPITEVPDLPCATYNGGCSDICLSLPNKERRCMCPLGKTLDSDQQTCDGDQQICPSDDEVYCKSSETCILKKDLCHELVTCQTLATEVICFVDNTDAETVQTDGECPDESYCEHLCTMTSDGPVCSCDPGLRVTSNLRNCTDIDECASSNGECSQRCHNTKGSYYCTCVHGFTLIGDKTTCRAKDHQRAYLMVSTERGIFKVQMDGEKNRALVFSSVPPRCFDVFPLKNVDTYSESSGVPVLEDDMLVYLTPSGDNESHSIIHKERRGAPVLRKVMKMEIREIRVDSVTRNIYLISRSGDSSDMTVCNEDVDNCIKIFSGVDWRPSGLIFHQARGRMYWMDTEDNAIDQAYMNGKLISRVMTGVKASGHLLTLDVVRERFYWVESWQPDSHSTTIQTAQLDGTDRYTLESLPMQHFHSIDIYEGYLYLTGGHVLHKVSSFSSRPVLAEMHAMESDIEDVRVVHTAPNIENPCASSTCPFLCVLGQYGAVCLCPNKSATECETSAFHTDINTEVRPTPPRPLLGEGIVSSRPYTVTPKTMRGDSSPGKGHRDPCEGYCLNGGTCYPFGAIALCTCAQWYGGYRCSVETKPDTTVLPELEHRTSSTQNSSNVSLPTPGQESSGTSSGTVAGVIIGVLVMVAFIVVGLFIFWKKFRCIIAGRRLGGVGYSVRDDQTALVPPSTVTEEYHYRKWDLDGNLLDSSSSSSDSAVYSNGNSPATIFRPTSVSSSS